VLVAASDDRSSAAEPGPSHPVNDLPTAAGEPQVLTVSRFMAGARLVIERSLPVSWVSGEISNLFRASSGHVYFDLKDATAQARCTLWRQKAQQVDFPLRNGLAVEVRAAPSLYEPRGEFQLNVDAIRQAGVGILYERFARLKERLQAAGWFAEARKRPLPRFPGAVGVVTSARGAALRDVLTTLRRRWPAAQVVVYPSAVQGAAAAPELAQAIRTASARQEVAVLIVCRGGGSIEDLWPFNEEPVARAILDCAIPVVTGVGHETDFTIADFVADVRAPTPTGAAALVVPDRAECGQRVRDVGRRLWRAGAHAMGTAAQRVDVASRRLVHPAAALAARRQSLAAIADRLSRAWQRQADGRQSRTVAAGRLLLRELRSPLAPVGRVDAAGQRLVRCGASRVERLDERLKSMAQHLAHLNPRAVLERGYAIVTDTRGDVVQDAAEVVPGDDVTLTFARGAAGATITRRR
jgi:exodeoxyribonuclease VII large subunit